MGSSLGFAEDSRLGPEPLLWSSPGAGRPGGVARNSRARPICAWVGSSGPGVGAAPSAAACSLFMSAAWGCAHMLLPAPCSA